MLFLDRMASIMCCAQVTSSVSSCWWVRNEDFCCARRCNCNCGRWKRSQNNTVDRYTAGFVFLLLFFIFFLFFWKTQPSRHNEDKIHRTAFSFHFDFLFFGRTVCFCSTWIVADAPLCVCLCARYYERGRTPELKTMNWFLVWISYISLARQIRLQF